MQRFSKIKPKSEINNSNDKVLFKNKYMSVIEYEDWSIVKESDFVVCIPYFIEDNQIILRQEYIPAFKYVESSDYYITLISGAIEVGETPQAALTRELEEEAGIVLSPDYKLEMMKPVFFSKGHTSRYFPFLVQLVEGQYHEVVPQGDGSKAEEMSRCIKIDLKYINTIQPADLITDFMLLKLKEYMNLE